MPATIGATAAITNPTPCTNATSRAASARVVGVIEREDERQREHAAKPAAQQRDDDERRRHRRDEQCGEARQLRDEACRKPRPPVAKTRGGHRQQQCATMPGTPS